MALEKIRPRVVDATGDYTFNNVTATGSILTSTANIGNITGVTNLVANTTTITVTGNLTTTANVSAGNIKTNNLLYANGNPWEIGASSTPPGGSTTQVQFNDAGSFGGSSNFTFNKSTNTLTVTNISGNGAGLSGLTGSNVTGQVGNSLVTGTVYTNAQPNITSVGTLTSLDITGTITSGNANLGNATISNYFIGNGSLLSSIIGSNITGQVGYAAVANSVAGSNVSGPVTYAATANAVAGANVMGTVAQATYAGTANSVAGANVSGNVTSAVQAHYANIANSVSGANVSGNVTSAVQAHYANIANSVSGANVSGTVAQATYAGTANSVAGSNVSGNVTSAVQSHYANIANSVAGSNVSGTVATATTAGTVTTAAQPNITSVGTLTSLSVTGDISGANLTLSGNLIVSGTTTSVNSTVTRVVDPIFELGGGANGAALATDDNKDRGLLLHYYSGSSTVDAFIGWDDSNGEFGVGSNVSVSSEVVTWNNYGNLRAEYFLGNGYYLTGVDAISATSADIANSIANGTSNINTPIADGNITVAIGGVSNTVVFTGTGINVAGYANISSGITTAGTITLGSGTGGNLTGANVLSANTMLASGNITAGNIDGGNLISANYISGNGYLLTGISAGSATSVVNGNSNISIVANSNASISIAGTSNVVVITSTGINLSGYINATRFVGEAGNVSNIQGANVSGNVTSAVQAHYANIANSVAGSNVSGTVAQATYAGTANSVAGANVSGTVSQATYAGTANSVAGANVSGNVTSAVQSHYANIANSVAGANVSGNVTSAVQSHYANIANSVAGSNVSGNVTGAVQAHYANIANSVAVSNVSGIGNIATINIDGNASNILYGNGAFAAAPAGGGSYGNSNVATFLTSYGSNTITTTGNVSVGNIIGNGQSLTSITGSNVSGNVTSAVQAHYANIANSVAGSNVSGTVATATNAGTVTTAAQPNITSVGSLTGLTVSNATGVVNFTTTANVTLGSVSNLHISGGTLGYVLSTDGSGTLSWVNASGGYSNTNAAAYLSTHTGNLTSGNANLGNAVVANYFVGSGAYLTGVDLLTVGNSDTANRISNGTSNVDTVVSGGNITVGIGGVSNTVIFTSTGVNVAGTLNVGGNAIVGNLTVTGTTTTVNSTITRVVDPIMELGGGANAAALTTDDNKDRGLLLHYHSGSATVDAFMGWDDSNGEFGVGSNVSVASEVVTWNNYGNLRAGYFIGNGAFLTGVGAASAGFIVNGTSNVNIPTGSGNVTTSVGGASNVVVVTSTGINVAGYVNTGVANVTANYFIGNGALLTGLDAAGRVVNGTSNISIPVASGNVTFGVGGIGNIVIITNTGIVVTGSGSISAAGGAITGGTLTGPLTTAAQPNITSLGTLTSVTVTGNANVGNINTGGNVYANSGIVKGQYIYGDGSNLTGLGGAGYIFNGTSNVYIPSSGANVYFTVGLTPNIVTVTSTGVNVAGYVNAGSGAITTTGNVTSGNANLGNLATANYFSGNFYGTANNASTVTTAAQPNITSLGTLANLTVTGPVNLGTISNINISGGAANYFLKTDGSGGLSWAVPAGGGGGGGTSLTYTAGTTPPASGNILGDQWFNTSANVLYEYISDGTSSYWVDISGATTTTTTPTTLDLANVSIAGGSNGQALISNGAGGLSFANLTQANIYNGNSNVTVVANSNVTFSIAGVSNVLTVTSTGANLIGTGTANLGNLVTANYVAGTLTTGEQPNITSVGTLSNLVVSGTTTYGLSADLLLTKTGATGTVTHDLSTGAVFYHTSPAANFTANFTNVPTNDGRILTVTIIINQGATPYVPTAVQIDSFSQTIKWIVGVTGTGTANKIDIFSFNLLRTGGSWTVIGQSTYYG